METQYKPYRVIPVRTNDDYALDRCNQRCKAMKDLGMSGSMSEYEKVLDYLLDDDRFKITYLKNLMDEIPEDTIRVVLRHDIDHDILSAVDMSHMEKKKRIPSSYYIATASPYYYGETFNDIFLRFEDLTGYYQQLQTNGAEVGLHLDSFFIYDIGIDGVQAINTELGWLREIGLDIRGFTAHGSFPYWGAENFEIFSEHLMSGRRATVIHGNEIKLGIASAEGFGLEYEGNYSSLPDETDIEKIIQYSNINESYSTKQFLYAYLHDNPCNIWGQDITVWLHGNDCWTVATTKKGVIFKFSITFEEVMETLENIELNQRIVFHIHPIYYGNNN